MTDLGVELTLFESKRLEWVKDHKGKHVVIQDATVLGFYDDWETGLKAALKAFPTGIFLVKEVLEKDRVRFVPTALEKTSCN